MEKWTIAVEPENESGHRYPPAHVLASVCVYESPQPMTGKDPMTGEKASFDVASSSETFFDLMPFEPAKSDQRPAR